MKNKQLDVWELWYPKAGAAGIYFSRSRIEPVDQVLVHAPPEVLTVVVRSADGTVKATGEDLKLTAETPMGRLHIVNGKVERSDIWPEEGDLERIVLLPGGEAGKLKAWWHAEDHSEWRWQTEFYNHK